MRILRFSILERVHHHPGSSKPWVPSLVQQAQGSVPGRGSRHGSRLKLLREDGRGSRHGSRLKLLREHKPSSSRSRSPPPGRSRYGLAKAELGLAYWRQFGGCHHLV
ncbi:hypothetical protein CRG98_044870 [Punica granatum]|uniref:Uncharacterized protein n=1 Tax=Punica granatum TaxID=22663 RepID=A0A2I0HSR2_PUNGR|nr:hypothetical protein CRG98_044870 [Punica granatum]